MSLRKVSDLEGLTIAAEYANGNKFNVLNSLLEISYLSTVDSDDKYTNYSFRSMYTRYNDIRDDILSAILSSETSVVFHDEVTFEKTVRMLCSLYLSGNFYLNLDRSDDEINAGERDESRTDTGSGYEMYIKECDNTIYAAGTGSLGVNLLCANYNRLVSKTKTTIESPNKVIADFTDDLIKLYSPVYTTCNISADKFCGTAICALWADLAEFYESDYDYESGTLVKFGGDKDITLADDTANAVVTTLPGLVLGTTTSNENKIMKGIALVGKVPVKVQCPIRKFDNITSNKSIPGTARKQQNILEKIIGKSLETNDSTNVELVECVVKLEF